MSEWPQVQLVDVLALKRGHDLPSTERGVGTVPIIGSFGITGTHNLARYAGPGVAIGRSGASIGVATYCPSEYWPLNTCLFVKDFHGNDARWVYYLLDTIDFSGFNSGSAQPSLNRNHLANIPVSIPPIAEQRGIATTLGALDDKIESNRCVQALALDLAESLYQRACEVGSTSMPLKSAGKWLSGGTPSTSNASYWGGDLPWISAASLKSFYVDESDRTLTAAGAEAATNIVPSGTVLMVVRGMSLKTEFRFGLAQRPVAFGQDCKAILPSINGPVLAIALRSMHDSILELVDEAGHGTGRLQTDLLEQVGIEVPDDPEFARVIGPLVARGASAARETKLLKKLRDALLPELLTGRVRVGEASAEAPEALA